MRNTWLVALREFQQRVRARGFWFSAIGVPLMLFFIMSGTGALSGDTAAEAVATQDATPVALGYVDEAGLIQNTAEALVGGLTGYPDRAAANSALAAGKIEAYYVVPADYRETGTVLRVAEQLPGIEVSGNETMDALLMDNLVSDAPADLRTRAGTAFGHERPALRGYRRRADRRAILRRARHDPVYHRDSHHDPAL
jgi:ABC-type Na+ efflux pump permease subunit